MNKLENPILQIVDAVAEAEGVEVDATVLRPDNANLDALLFQALPRERPGRVFEVGSNGGVAGLPVDGGRDGVDARGRALRERDLVNEAFENL
jgi:hypothetical protein